MNIGLQPIAGNLIIEENNFILASSIFNKIGTSDTSFINLEIPPMPSGYHEIIISLDINGDENIENNMVSIPILE